MDVFNSKKSTVSIDISDGDSYAYLLDDDSIIYTLYDVEGNVVENLENVKIDPSDLEDKSKIIIEIPGEANTLVEGETFSNRILIVNYTVSGVGKEIRYNYRVIPFVPYTCNNDDVRKTLGVSSTIIEDNMIDLYGAYLKGKSLFEDETLLDSALKSSDIKSIQANRLIVINSALTFRTSLMLMTPKIESDSVVSQTRFTMSAEDFEKLFDDLNDELQDLIDEISDEDISQGYSPELFVVGELTDTFTGG